jgi:hypothetical protein
MFRDVMPCRPSEKSRKNIIFTFRAEAKHVASNKVVVSKVGIHSVTSHNRALFIVRPVISLNPTKLFVKCGCL